MLKITNKCNKVTLSLHKQDAEKHVIKRIPLCHQNILKRHFFTVYKNTISLYFPILDSYHFMKH